MHKCLIIQYLFKIKYTWMKSNLRLGYINTGTHCSNKPLIINSCSSLNARTLFLLCLRKKSKRMAQKSRCQLKNISFQNQKTELCSFVFYRLLTSWASSHKTKLTCKLATLRNCSIQKAQMHSKLTEVVSLKNFLANHAS